MLIQIKVAEQQARRAIQSLQGDLTRLQSSARAAGNASAGVPARGSAAALTKWGSQIQWAGRQLTYNFTIPLGIAAVAATKFALENEKAMVRVNKVYGDNSEQFNKVSKTELPALEKAFESLSEKFGVHQKEVIGIAADWAAAGASGIALAKGVGLTLETMVLGELEAADATKALIAIQAQYGESVDDLSKTIDVLNMVENQTGATMGDLIESLQRAAGVARSAGVDVRHLAAMTAALVPSAGSAANAGNALKTIMSRMLAPTKEAAEVMGLMGINVKDLGWQSLNGAQRIEIMAEKFEGLADSQKAVVSAVIASRWQINKFDVLMRDIVSPTGYYNKALQATASESANAAQKMKELNAVLDSNPHKMSQMWVMLQNALANIIQPLIPWIVYAAKEIAQLAQSFQNLDPWIQKLSLGLLVVLALIGPLARYIGAVALLFGMLGKAFASVGPHLAGLVAGLGKIVAMPFALLGKGLWLIPQALSGIAAAVPAVVSALWTFTKATGLVSAASSVWAMIPIAMAKMFATLRTVIAAGWAGAKILMVKGIIAAWAIKNAGIGNIIASTFGAMFASVAAVVTRGWAIIAGVMTRGALFATTIGPAIAAGLARLNFMFHTLMFTVIPATVARGWAAINLAMMRGVVLMSVMFTRGVPMMMSAMASVMAGMIGAVWAGIGAIQRVMGPLAARLGLLMAQAMWAMQIAMSKAYVAMVAMSRAVVMGIAVLWSRLVPLIMIGLAKLGPALLLVFRRALPVILAFIKTWGPRLIGVLTGPIGMAVTIIATLLGIFWDDITSFFKQLGAGLARNAEGIAKGFQPLVGWFGDIVNGIHRVFNKLPEGIQKAMIAVVNVIKTAALAIYDWFSWMRPEVRHSPSLIESVTNGMAEIKRQYASVGNAGAVFKKAAQDLKAFKEIASAMGGDEWSEKRTDVSAAMPSNLGNFNALVGIIGTLNRLLAEQSGLVNAQQAVVNGWKSKLDAANGALDKQEAILSGLSNALGQVTDQYAAHKTAMDNYASSGIVGMQAMSDEIFANQMAQKALQLQIMDLEAAGGSVDDITGKMASLQGEIEKLRGDANDLRGAGAGSDVLGPLNEQIKQMEDSYKAMGEGLGQDNGMSELQKQLDELKKQGERLDLENSLNFDPLLRQIEQTANASKELTFEEIIAGINNERAAMESLQPKIDAAQAAYDSQKLIVDNLTTARDALNLTYQDENSALQALQDEYALTESAIREIESALNDVASAASRMPGGSASGKGAGGSGGGADSMSPGAQNFMDAAGGDFADVGGQFQIGREGGMEDQSGLIEEFTAGIQDDLNKALGSINPFQGLAGIWEKVKGWWTDTFMPGWNGLVGGIGDAFAGIDMSGAQEKLSGVGAWFSDLWSGITDGASVLWDLFGPQLLNIWENIKSAVGPALDDIKVKLGPLLDSLKGFGESLGTFFSGLWEILKPVLAFIGGVLVAGISAAFRIIGNIIGPVIEWIGNIISGLIGIITGVITFISGVLTTLGGIFTLIVGLFTGNGEKIRAGWSAIWDGLGQAVSGLWTIVSSTFTAIWDTIKGALAIAWGIVSGFVQGIVDFFTWLWDVLVGHSIVPDMVNAIVQWFQDMWDKAVAIVSGLVQGVIAFFTNLWNQTVAIVTGLVRGVLEWWENLKRDVTQKVVDLVTAALNKWEELKSKAIQFIIDMVLGILKWWDDLKRDTKQKVVDIVTTVLDKFQEIKKGAEDKFNAVRDAIMNAFTYVSEKIGGIFGDINGFIKSGINVGIRAVNKLITGLNKVADILPGLDWNISAIPELARGGAIPTKSVGSGFMTNGARAIVGEGKQSYPEFVIPTDPSHRKRAADLYSQLGQRIGMGTDDTNLGIGGPIDSIKSFIGSGANLAKQGMDWIQDAAAGAVSKIFGPVKDIAQGMINNIGWDYGKKTAQAGLNEVWGWVTNSDEAYRKAAGETGGSGPWRKPVSPYSLSSPYGYRIHPITGQRKLHAGMDLAAPMGQAVYAAAQGAVSQHVMSGGLGNYLKVNHGLGLETWYGHLSSFVGGPRQVAPGDLIGRIGSTGASTGPHLHFEVHQSGMAIDPRPWMQAKGVPLKTGGIVSARAGGTLATIGEGGQDEAVIPLPTGWKNMFSASAAQQVATIVAQKLVILGTMEGRGGVQSGDTYNDNRQYHFHGNLEFPNIKDANDADEFIRNLEDLAGDK